MSTTETTESTETTPAEVIDLTEAASKKVAELLTFEQNPDLALRIAVRPGGCSGYSYEMFFDSELTPEDVQTVRGAVRVVVDSASAQLLTGATLDYKDGLQGAGFSINNPNATRSCGCGQSFS
ncbi:MAG TPA: iron-sulfur cluster insertion protein ErpA [Acidimicrobiales bacterium]|nr:iron-sulfur cluster insertion protein ErpA [Acidimicrobiales bacterium]